MNNNIIFEGIDYENDKYFTIKDALNVVGFQGFPEAVSYWLKGIGYGVDGGGIDFPEDDDIFEGVRGYYLNGSEDEEIIISEEEFYQHLKIAIQRYIKLHPEKREELEQIMSRSTLV